MCNIANLAITTSLSITMYIVTLFIKIISIIETKNKTITFIFIIYTISFKKSVKSVTNM